ncbi:MAG: HD domain-containing protein [Myxococcota bacterium]|nr:HD domain-containing protein [Myxococcota bacterium]
MEPFPDSPLCRASEAHLRAVSSPTMFHHGCRTYAFAMALGERASLKPDREVLYVSALLHDLGLEAPLAEAEGDFEDVGGWAAAELVREHGAPDAFADAVRSAIALHTNVQSAEDARAEVALLHMGAMVDVVGARIEEVPEGFVHDVLERYPRLGCKDLLVRLLSEQVERKPDSHIAQVFRLFGLPELIRNAPFDE